MTDRKWTMGAAVLMEAETRLEYLFFFLVWKGSDF